MGIPAGYEKLATIGIAYKNDYDPAKEYKFLNAVYYSGSTYVSLKDNPVGPPADDKVNWQYMAKGFVEGVMSAINATDTSGVTGDVGETVNAQTLIDAISDRVMTKLIEKNKIVTDFLATDPTTVAAGTTVKELMDKCTQLNGELPQILIDGGLRLELLDTGTIDYRLALSSKDGKRWYGDIRIDSRP